MKTKDFQQLGSANTRLHLLYLPTTFENKYYLCLHSFWAKFIYQTLILTQNVWTNLSF